MDAEVATQRPRPDPCLQRRFRIGLPDRVMVWLPQRGRRWGMVAQLLIASALMALCVVIHAGGVTWAAGRARQWEAPTQRLWPWMRLFVRVAAWIVLLHVVEITAWALVYAWGGAIAGIQAAAHFSAVTYTTTGYGDLLLPEDWRLVGAIEALTGILMCGWSTGFFFALASRMYADRAA